jgi:hypothetical protein
MGYQQHYAKLFEQLEDEYGELDKDTIAAIIGFSTGGPVREKGKTTLCDLRAVRL